MKGILFKPDMHQAIREGRKTVTRRLDHLKEINQEPDKWEFREISARGEFVFANSTIMISKFIKPRYHVGEVVYIKEAIFIGGIKPDEWVAYKLDSIHPKNYVWRSPLFMPAWAARYFIKITGVRPERLLPISDEEAIKEGIIIIGRPILNELSKGKFTHYYLKLWDSINLAYPFSMNPWLWRIEYKLQETK